MDPVTSYWVKIVAGAVAFLVWLFSVTSINGGAPIFGIDSAAQQILFGAAVAAFGWGVLQGSSAVRTAARGH